MAARYVERITSFTSALRDLVFPNAVRLQYDNTEKQLKFADADSTIRTINAPAAPSTTTAAAVTVTVADRGRMFVATATSGTQTFTLPTAASMPGAELSFVCGHADGEILINPNAADQISIKGLVDHSTSVKPAAGTGVKNTAATNVLGDHLRLRSDGVLTWHEQAGAGIWASQ